MSDEMAEAEKAATAPKKRARRTKAGSTAADTNAPLQETVSNAAETVSKTMAGQLDLLAGLAGTTSRIVTQAASILEEELAAGIGASQNIEKKFVDVEKIRSADSQEVIQRFRKDAHDVIDILIDLINVATNAVGNLGERAVNIGIGPAQAKSGFKDAPKGGPGAIPSLAVPTIMRPGDQVEIPMTLENDSDRPTEAFQFLSSDLVNTDGQRIAAQQITFVPERLTIEPRKSTTVTVMVHVPETTSPGTYSGLLQASRMDQLRAVLSVQVV